jgi:hypothetical protein
MGHSSSDLQPMARMDPVARQFESRSTVCAVSRPGMATHMTGQERRSGHGVRPEHESGVPSTASTETPQAPDEPLGDFQSGNDPTGGTRWCRRRMPLAAMSDAPDALDAVLALPGVARASIESDPPELIVDMDPDVLSDDELMAAVSRGGLVAESWSEEEIPEAEFDARRE